MATLLRSFWQITARYAAQDLKIAAYGAEEVEETAKYLLKGRQKRIFTLHQVDELVQTSSSANSAPSD